MLLLFYLFHICELIIIICFIPTSALTTLMLKQYDVTLLTLLKSI